MAIRLPKTILAMSGLSGTLDLEVKKGQITIRSKANPRAGWREQIKASTEKYGDDAKEFADMDALIGDGLENLPWDGLSYEKWLKSHGKHS